MEQSDNKDQEGRGIYVIKTFPVPFALEEIKKNIPITREIPSKPSKEQIINQAFKFHSEGNISEAAKYYQYFIEEKFHDHRVFSNYGTILKSLGKLEEAEISYHKAIEINPQYAEAYSNLGNLLRDIGKLYEAEQFTRKAIDLNPNYANAHSNLGNILKDLGKLQEAEISYQKAIAINPDLAEAHSNLGSILIDLGKLEEAEISYQKAIAINPQYVEAHSNLGNLLRDIGKLEEAEISYQKAIAINPQYAEAHSNLGNLLRDLGKLHEAEQFTRKAIDLNPNYADAHSNLGNILKDLGKLKEGEISYQKAIAINPNLAEAYSNLGGLLIDLGKLQEAEQFTRKAITLNPDLAEAHSNLGGILIDLGKLQEAEISYQKAITINPNLTRVYYALSKLKKSNNSRKYKKQIFSNNILDNKLVADKVNIYFARANIHHKEKNYRESATYLKLANKLKMSIIPSNCEILINKSHLLLLESSKESIKQQKYYHTHESIFIVGMPRSGSTLVESILSINPNVNDLGEINILEESFLKRKRNQQELPLAVLYWDNVINNKKKFNITTNKWLYNYQYAGIIARQIPNAKIIHCYRNPLDNLLSIYRTHFAAGNEYSSSLTDCAKVYIDQEKVMTEYKNRFRSKIYDLNYDLLVGNPNQEIKDLISWLGWQWNDSYLSPHLNPRSVLTASNVQVRSPINSKSIGGWINYKEMLQPAAEILDQTNRYRDLYSKIINKNR